MNNSKIVIVYHSGYGHTAKVAEAVAEGSGGTLLADRRRRQPARRRLGADRRRRRGDLRQPDLHGQRQLAVQEVRRRVEQALVHAGLEGQAGRRLHQQRHAQRRQAVDDATTCSRCRSSTA